MSDELQLARDLIQEEDFISDKIGAENVEKIDCAIGAIYDISFAHHLVINGLKESNLDPSNEMAEFRQLWHWPSASRFIFSHQQMLEAYKKVAQNSASRKFMSFQQIEDAVACKKSQKAMWSILGENRSAFESFSRLMADQEREKLRALARAFRLTLFQLKVNNYKQAMHFLVMIDSVNAELAHKAFSTCMDFLPFDPILLQTLNAKSFAANKMAEKSREEELEAQMLQTRDDLQIISTMIKAIDLKFECQPLPPNFDDKTSSKF